MNRRKRRRICWTRIYETEKPEAPLWRSSSILARRVIRSYRTGGAYLKPINAPRNMWRILIAGLTLIVLYGIEARGQSKSNKGGQAPVSSGPGIQICEPVASVSSDTALADFGSACGEWLQWSMGFSPQ